MKCIMCGNKMNKIIIYDYRTVWGDVECTIDEVKANLCLKCGHINHDPSEARRIQNIAKKNHDIKKGIRSDCTRGMANPYNCPKNKCVCYICMGEICTDCTFYKNGMAYPCKKV